MHVGWEEMCQGSDSDGSCCPLPALGSSVIPGLRRGAKPGADIPLLVEFSLQALLPELWGMRSKDQPLLTWEQGSSALGSKSNKCGFMQTEVPPEQTFQWHPAPSPQLPEGTPNPADTLISAHHPHVWEQEGVGCWGLGQQQH